MEPNQSVSDAGGERKPSSEQITNLHNTCLIGLGILRDGALKAGTPPEEAHTREDRATKSLEAITDRALSGSAEAVSILNQLAEEFISEAGRQDAAAGPNSSDEQCSDEPAIQEAPRFCRTDGGLPVHAAKMSNYPENPPKIAAQEVTEFLNSRDFFLLAKADYERRRAQLLYELHLCCELEEQGDEAPYLISLGDDGETIRITDRSSVEEEEIIDRR